MTGQKPRKTSRFEEACCVYRGYYSAELVSSAVEGPSIYIGEH